MGTGSAVAGMIGVLMVIFFVGGAVGIMLKMAKPYTKDARAPWRKRSGEEGDKQD